MTTDTERREEGKDRRACPPTQVYSGRERRVSDRRQVSVVEITFREWAMHLVHFKQHLLMRQKRRAEREARRREEKAAQAQALAKAGTVSGSKSRG